LRKASDFTVYERGGIWYVQWLSRQGKRYWKSTGERVQQKLKDRGQKAALCAASMIIGSGRRSEAPVLAEYAKDIYRWDASSFIKRQHAKGRGFNRAWANALQSMIWNTMSFLRSAGCGWRISTGPWSKSGWSTCLWQTKPETRSFTLSDEYSLKQRVKDSSSGIPLAMSSLWVRGDA
jgi:hypothetical protein